MYQVIGAKFTRTLRVLWMLEELGAPYQHDREPYRTEKVLALNPNGRIPILMHEDVVITDSMAILTYLTDRHERFTARPGSLDRARQDAMTFRILDEIEATLWTAARHNHFLPRELQMPEITPSLMWEFERSLGQIMEMAEGPCLMGEEPTVPDFLLTHCGFWAAGSGFPIGLPAYEAYLSRMQQRPALRHLLSTP